MAGGATMIAPDEGGSSVATVKQPSPPIMEQPPGKFYIPPGAARPADPDTSAVIRDTKRIKASMSPWMKVAVVGATGAGLFLLFAILKTRK